MEYNVKISSQELQILVSCLHEAPYKLVASLLDKLQHQVTDQEKHEETIS